MNKPLVSVLMPSYNHVKYLRDAIESVWRQPYKNIELVVVDDASSDGSFELLTSLKAISPIPMHIHRNEKNSGPTRTVERTYELSNGELIAFLASDDLFAPNRFETSVGCFLDNPNLSLLYADGTKLHTDGELSWNVHGEGVKALLGSPVSEILNYLYTHSSPFFLQAAMVRRYMLEGAFDASVTADDWVINIRMFRKLLAGGEYCFLDQIVFYYRQHGENVHRNIERHIALQQEVIDRYTPANLKRQASANIYWNIGDSLIFTRPLKATRYLFISQINSFRPGPMLRIAIKIMRVVGGKLIREFRGLLALRKTSSNENTKQKTH